MHTYYTTLILHITLPSSVGRYHIFMSGIRYYKLRTVFGISRYLIKHVDELLSSVNGWYEYIVIHIIRTCGNGYYSKFLVRKTSMFSLFGLSKVLFLDATCPDVLNNRSDAQLDTQTHKYFLASLAKVGYADSWIFHQSRGLESASGLMILLYCSISSFINSVLHDSCSFLAAFSQLNMNLQVVKYKLCYIIKVAQNYSCMASP